MIGRGSALVTASLGQIKNRSRKIREDHTKTHISCNHSSRVQHSLSERRLTELERTQSTGQINCFLCLAILCRQRRKVIQRSQIQVRCLRRGPRGLFPLRNEPGTALWWTGSEFWVKHCALYFDGLTVLAWALYTLIRQDRRNAQSIWTNKSMRMERRRRYSKPPCNSVESLGRRVEEPSSPCHCPGLCSWEISTLT